MKITCAGAFITARKGRQTNRLFFGYGALWLIVERLPAHKKDRTKLVCNRFVLVAYLYTTVPLVIQRATGSGLGMRLARLRSEGRKHYNLKMRSRLRGIFWNAHKYNHMSGAAGDGRTIHTYTSRMRYPSL